MENQTGLRVAVVGLGQIGGSIARGLTAKGHTVVAVDPDGDTRDQALASGAVVEALPTANALEGTFDIAFLAAWPSRVIDLLAAPDVLPAATIVTDCASVKVACERACHPSNRARYIGGHPMAGNEGVGFASSNPGLFEGRTWVLTRHSDVLESAIRDLGAIPIIVDAETHDREVALLSHLPNLLANLLVTMGADVANPTLAAGTWQGATRVAGSNPDLWAEILRLNKEQVQLRLAELARALDDVGKTEDFAALWQNARRIKDNHGW